MAGLTFDTGALVALERRRQRMRRVLATAIRDNLRVSVPAVVITEWWRGRTDLADDILASVDVEPMDEDLAKVAGEALAAVKRSTAIDAIVMASAARRGDVVYTSDFYDLSRLQTHFRSVRVLGI